LEREGLGGKARHLERIENLPGFPIGISGRALMNRYRRCAAAWGLVVRRAEATRLGRLPKGFSVTTPSGTLWGRSVLLCTGTRFKRWSNLDGGEIPVFASAFSQARSFEGRKVAVVGGGESAMHQSLRLAGHAKTVYLIHRGRALRGIELLRRRLAQRPNVRVFPESELFPGTRGTVRVRGRAQDRSLAVSAVFALIGQEPELSLLREGRAPSGVFIAGDARPGTRRQIAAATGDAMRAAMECEEFLSGR